MAPRRETAPFRKALGQVIWETRGALGLSQEELGFRAEVDRTYVSGLENGTRNPTLETIIRIAEALKMRPSKLLSLAEGRLG